MLSYIHAFVSLVICATLASALPSPSTLEERQILKAAVITSCTVPNTAALTFDDGPYIWLHEIVDMLDAAGAKGTFFFSACLVQSPPLLLSCTHPLSLPLPYRRKQLGCIYDDAAINRVKYTFDHGHQVASHTWAHKQLMDLSKADINTEMARTEEAIQRITGAHVAFTRTPYGDANDAILEVAASRGQHLVKWDFDSQDGLAASVAHQKKLYDDVVKRRPHTILSLQHEVHESSVRQVLPYAIQKLQEAGYNLVTVSECLGGIPAYKSVGHPETKTSAWKC